MIHLSKRLSSIYNLTPKGIAIDVGADHGQLIISLVENGVAHHGYAVENKKGPYERMVKAINASKVKDKIIPIFSSGIHEMPKEVETVIIAGMGGNTIVNILKDDIEKLNGVKTILIDSHGAFSFVRQEIINMGFIIDDEDILVEDDIYYEIMRFKRGSLTYSEDDYFFGPVLLKKKSNIFKEKWMKRLDEINSLLCKSDIPTQRKDELLMEKERIMRVL